MKRNITNTILIFLILITGFVFVMAPDLTLAQENEISASQVPPQTSGQGTGIISRFFAFTGLPDLVNSTLANLTNLALAGAGYILYVSGRLLDVSIRLTLNIKDFVNATPAIYTVWKILRDITGLFFIFFLLYAAIQMMTGIGKGPSYASTIKNIVIAGILINFSFFITSVAIDFSNVISQAIYNAMVPNRVVMQFDNNGLQHIVENSGKSDISNIFMNSLRIQSIYDVQGNKLGVNIGDPIKIILIGITGVTMMITTAASFFFASIAFIARLVILLFLLAFSSIWFAGMVIPQINSKVKQFVGALYSQLIFMPAYLLLMYVALTIINSSNLLEAGNVQNLTASMTGTNWIMPYVFLAVNFAIVIFILNLPLVVGLSLGGMATDWMKSGINKFNAMNVWKGMGGVAGTNTIGRFASWADKKVADTPLGNSYTGRQIRGGTTGALAKTKFGGSQSWEDKSKIMKEVKSKRAEIDRKNEAKEALGYAIKGITPPTGKPILKDSLKKMGVKERLDYLGAKKLKEPNVVKILSSKDFKAIKEDKDNLFTEEDKREIFEAREKALKDALASDSEENTKTVKHMIDNMDGDELLGLNDKDILKNPNAIKFFKSSQLEKMDKERLDPEIKNIIKGEIDKLGADKHPAYGWVNDKWRYRGEI